MPKPSKFTDPDMMPQSFSVPGLKPVIVKKAPPVATRKAPKPRYVRVENKLRQVMVLSLRDDNGTAVELRLGPSAVSDPIREDRLTEQIRRFAADGRVRLR